MKDTIIVTYLSILLPIMGIIYNAPKSINLLINGILFISSISMLFLTYFNEKENNKFTHLIPLFLIYNIYNFLISIPLGITGLFIYFLIYKKYKNENYDLSKLDSIVPIKFLFSKLSKPYYILILLYFLLLAFLTA